jgi:hypothetical protein
VLYRCFIVGEDFPLIEDGQKKMFGFATTRWVEANSSEEAELKAIEALKKEPRFDFPPELRDPRSRVLFEEVTPVEPIDVPDVLPGLAWFPMDSD